MSSKSTFVPFGTGAGVTLRLLSSPISQSTRVREPVKPTTGRVVGYFPSIKNNRSIAWESQLEQKACYVFEFSPEVLKYREQPLSIYYQYETQFLRYTPDFELTLVSGELVYVEIKPLAKIQHQEILKKLEAISEYWVNRKRKFILITDKELNHPILQSNLRLLRSYLRVQCDPELIQISLHWLSQLKTPLFGDLVNYTGSINKCYALLAQQHISIDLHREIQSDSPLFLFEECCHENQLFSCRVAPDFK